MNPPVRALLKEPDQAWEEALRALQNGEIILFPTDTVYGLGVDSRATAAIARLYAVKGRPREKPFQWLVADIACARKHSSGWDARAEKLARAFWPGPLTLVVPHHGEGIGWRVPRHDGLLGLLAKLGRPLIASSANQSGKPPRMNFQPARREFADILGFAVDGGRLTASVASTVVILETRQLRVARQGVISEEQIHRALG